MSFLTELDEYKKLQRMVDGLKENPERIITILDTACGEEVAVVISPEMQEEREAIEKRMFYLEKMLRDIGTIIKFDSADPENALGHIESIVRAVFGE